MKTLSRVLCALLLFILPPSSLILSAAAQETPPPKKAGVKLQFLPPPMEGTVSLGIYDSRGKLVRTLHREADKTDLNVALDGLITSWDGKDDAGNIAPAGKYHARGFVVGEITIEGEAFHFNDWITGDDSPRVRRIAGVADAGNNQLCFNAVAADGNAVRFLYDFETNETRNQTEAEKNASLNFADKVEVATAKDAKLAIAIDTTAQAQSVRGILSSSSSTRFEKTIVFSDELAQVKDRLKLADEKLFVPVEKIPFSVRANPLNQNKPGSVEIGVGFDASGSFLKTADGLPLRAVSETKNLKWVAIGRAPDSKAVVIFQSDGAVVEQFRATGLRDMMAFDCGEFEFDPAKLK